MLEEEEGLKYSCLCGINGFKPGKDVQDLGAVISASGAGAGAGAGAGVGVGGVFGA